MPTAAAAARVSAALTFGPALRFEADLLGTHAQDGSWLWAWGNPGAELPPGNRRLAEAVRGLTARTGIAVFDAPGVGSCEQLLGRELAFGAAHVFGIVVCGELGYNAYYTMPYATGRAIGVIRDDRLLCNEPYPLVRVASTF